MTHEQLEAWFDSRIGLNFSKGQGRFLEALDLLGHPEREFASVQIGGQMGKVRLKPFWDKFYKIRG